MPRGIPKSGKRAQRSSGSFDLSALQAEMEGHRLRIMGPIDRRIAQLTSEIEKLNSLKSSFGGGNGGGSSASSMSMPRRGRPPGAKNVPSNGDMPAPKATRKGRRVRRSRGDVEKHAQDILDFVKSTKNGVTGTQIKDKFGKIIGTVKNYVKQYTGVDLQSAGPKTSMRYTVK